MASISSAQKSAKITDVLQILYNPRTPEATKQRALRRLDGLEGRLAPIPKGQLSDQLGRGRASTRSSLDVDEKTARSLSLDTDSSSGSSCRFSITEGVAPLASADLERRLSPSPKRSATTGGRRRVIFIDQWEELEGREHDNALRDSLRIGTESDAIQN